MKKTKLEILNPGFEFKIVLLLELRFIKAKNQIYPTMNKDMCGIIDYF